jgi:hypothetical protein
MGGTATKHFQKDYSHLTHAARAPTSGGQKHSCEAHVEDSWVLSKIWSSRMNDGVLVSYCFSQRGVIFEVKSDRLKPLTPCIESRFSTYSLPRPSHSVLRAYD